MKVQLIIEIDEKAMIDFIETSMKEDKPHQEKLDTVMKTLTSRIKSSMTLKLKKQLATLFKEFT